MAVPGHRFRLDNYDVEGLRKAIAEQRVDLVITNPGYYVTMEAEFGLSRIDERITALPLRELPRLKPDEAGTGKIP